MSLSSVRTRIVLFAIIIFAVSCSANAGESNNNAGESIDKDSKTQMQSDIERDNNPAVSDADIAELVSGNTAFACDLYQWLIQDNDNLIFSPFSISMALAMTWGGAAGQTRTDMANVLHFALDDESLHASFNSVDLALGQLGADTNPSRGESFRLNVANSLWLREGFQLNPEFLDLIARNYGAGLDQLDFSGDPDGSADTINNWIDEKTQGRIQNVIQPGPLANMMLIIINAIYFKASWSNTFSEYATSDGEFHVLDGSPVTVPMMHQTEHHRYYDGSNFQAASFSYLGYQTSMVILLPGPGEFENFERSLDADTIATVLNGLESQELRVTMPKFEYDTSLSLADTLKAMGMESAFGGGFDSMVQGDLGNEGIFIGDVIHRAFIAVDEEGTEAAAVTVVEMPTSAAPMDDPPEPIEFKVDRPFIYLIREHSTNSILFIGRVLDPS